MKIENSVNNLFSVLSDPTRRQIVEILSDGQTKTVSEITRHFGISRQAVTKHLALLHDSGLLSYERRGRDRHNRLQPEALDPLIEWTRHYSIFWSDHLMALKQQIEQEEP